MYKLFRKKTSPLTEDKTLSPTVIVLYKFHALNLAIVMEPW